MRTLFLATLLITAMTLLAPAASAQILYGQPASGNTGVIYTHWKLEGFGVEATLDQWLMPVSGFVPLREDTEARFYVARARNTLGEITGDYELNGMTDLRLQVSRSYSRDRYLLSAGLNLPTGKTGLGLDSDWLVMNLLTQNFLQFPSRRLGEGLGLNLMAGTATTWGDRRVGVSMTLNHVGGYEAYEGEGDYDPGDSLVLTAGIEGNRRDLVWRGDITFTTHTDDQLEGRKVYSQGVQLGLHAGASLERDGRQHTVDIRYLVRGRNSLFDDSESLASRLKVYGNELALAGSVSWIKPDGLYFGPQAEIRQITGNEFGFGGSTVLGFGFLAGNPLNKQLNLNGGLKFFTGSTDDGNIDLSGYQISLSVSGHL
ncbi:MAG: hypothetical protein ABIF77_13465 [bacterium]